MLVGLFTISGREIMPQVKLNTPAPDFNLTDFRGNQVQLSDFRKEKILVLVFNRGFF
jgi:peroxiredoxin